MQVITKSFWVLLMGITILSRSAWAQLKYTYEYQNYLYEKKLLSELISTHEGVLLEV